MRGMTESWAVVMAGGEGSRLKSLTTTREGIAIPKQYCSLKGSGCLLQDALARARAVALPSHVCAVVASQHRRWWSAAAAQLNEANVFVQPRNRGTAHGILLALLRLEAINPQATVTLLPADHYFRDESAITRSLRIAANFASADRGAIYILGIEPEAPDPEFGYILPALPALRRPGTAAGILGFVEKPAPAHARELISLGALWNLFILVGTVSRLVGLVEHEHAAAVAGMRAALARPAAEQAPALERWYETAGTLDFSRDVLELHAQSLQSLRVPHCGWTDLGTPQRVLATVRELSMRAGLIAREPTREVPLFFDLGAAGERLTPALA